MDQTSPGCGRTDDRHAARHCRTAARQRPAGYAGRTWAGGPRRPASGRWPGRAVADEYQSAGRCLASDWPLTWTWHMNRSRDLGPRFVRAQVHLDRDLYASGLPCGQVTDVVHRARSLGEVFSQAGNATSEESVERIALVRIQTGEQP